MLEAEIKNIEAKPTEENCQKADALLRALDKRWDDGFSTLENELRKMRVEALDGLRGGIPLEVSPKIGRNEPCPCSSGKKYKTCCLH